MGKRLLVLLMFLTLSGTLAVRADEKSERVLTLEEISQLDSALKQALALSRRSQLLNVGKSTPADVEKMLGAPSSKSKDGSTWFYGDIFWGPYLQLDFSSGRFSKIWIECKCY